jgi:4,5-dihydroxyphthalate decarboxylase
MPTPACKTALVTYPHTQALKDGTVVPRTFTFDFEEVPAIIKAFRRMVRGLEFDISEMAITTYLTAKAHGKRFTAVPVFPMRAFHHGAILYNTKSDVRTPKDLEGRKVGVNRGYTVTTGLWARSILQHEYGVDLKKITWVLSGDEHVAEYRPAGQRGADRGRAHARGDAAVRRARRRQRRADGLARHQAADPNAKEAGLDGLRRAGLYPINHTVVVKTSCSPRIPASPPICSTRSSAPSGSTSIGLQSGAIAEPTAADKTFAA